MTDPAPERTRAPGDRPPASARSWLAGAAIALGAFAAGTLLAEALGAVNLGTALGVGQIAFAIALMWVMLRD